jgi:Asp-tRNA(Asn)/Glu-tRNA(Gln) amidotransferase A subunit family amidase
MHRRAMRPRKTSAPNLAGEARTLARQIARRTLSAAEWTADCIAAIERREAAIGAWAYFDRDQALRQARAADAALRRVNKPKPLHGVPIAVKDIFDTADMPTEYGTPLHAGHRPKADAWTVAHLRALGAVILGKTVTTEFAIAAAGKTRNPHDPARTPGGSSSGSAAAVAAGMAPVALGTQTGASIIRPAAYCGVVGYKPSFGLIPRTGILPAAPSFDHAGVLARTVADAAWLAQHLLGRDAGDPAAAPPKGLRLHPLAPEPRRPRLVFLRTPLWETVEPLAAEALLRFAAQLRIEERELPALFARAAELFRAVGGPEMAQSLAADWERGAAEMSQRLCDTLEAGRKVSAMDYLEGQAAVASLRRMLADVLADVDAAITPATTGPAPLFESGTGNPVCSLIWSLTGAPSLSLPLLALDGLPLGVQVVGPHGTDRSVLRAAHWLERRCAKPV